MTEQLIEKRCAITYPSDLTHDFCLVDNKMGEKILGLKARPEHSRDQISLRFEGRLFTLTSK